MLEGLFDVLAYPGAGRFRPGYFQRVEVDGDAYISRDNIITAHRWEATHPVSKCHYKVVNIRPEFIAKKNTDGLFADNPDLVRRKQCFVGFLLQSPLFIVCKGMQNTCDLNGFFKARVIEGIKNELLAAFGMNEPSHSENTKML